MVNVGLVLLNAGVWFYLVTLTPAQAVGVFLQYGFIPASVGAIDWASPGALGRLPELAVPMLTAMFLHGGWMHVIGNMIHLWVFGDNIEDRMGHGRYLLFYLLCGIAATAAHTLANPMSDRPVVGASGAVAGVLGAYLINFPRARVLALVPLGFFLHLTEVPAAFFLLVWFGLQLIYGLGGLVGVSEVGQLVAWWAHVGGFVTGVTLGLVLARRPSGAR